MKKPIVKKVIDDIEDYDIYYIKDKNNKKIKYQKNN